MLRFFSTQSKSIIDIGDATMIVGPIFDSNISSDKKRETALLRWNQLQSFVPEPTSYLINAYAKSGTHWLWEVMTMLMRGKAEIVSEMKEEVFLEMKPVDQLLTSPPYPFNTHITPSKLPKNFAALRTLIILRNPKDVIVSGFHHIAKELDTGICWNEFLKCCLDTAEENPPRASDNIWQFAKEAWSKRHDRNVLLIFYEDVVQDFHREISKLCKFMDIDVNDEFIGEIEALTQISSFKEKKSAKVPKSLHAVLDYSIRKGKVGQWKDYFTVAQSEAIDKHTARLLKECEDLQFTYE